LSVSGGGAAAFLQTFVALLQTETKQGSFEVQTVSVGQGQQVPMSAGGIWLQGILLAGQDPSFGSQL